MFQFKQRKGVETGEMYRCRPLHAACVSSSAHSSAIIVQCLLEAGCKVNACDASKAHPLHYACEHGFGDNGLAVVTLLLEAGANLCATNGQRQNPLHLACKAGAAPIVALLLRHEGSQLIGARDFDLRLPLHYASEASAGPTIELLLTYIDLQPPDSHIVQTQSDRSGSTAFHLAVSSPASVAYFKL